jgi:hypothetical protein
MGFAARATGAAANVLRGPPMSKILAYAVQRLRQACDYMAALLAIDPPGTYRPEAHYMRGPGPKWRAKHARPER